MNIIERKRTESKLSTQIEKLQCCHSVNLGSEGRILDLKREVNELLGKAGQPSPYSSAESQKKKEK